MHKSILVLEESTMVHDLFESALPREYWDWHIEHESLPENYVARTKETLPGIIFLSNQDQKNDYAVVKAIRSADQIKHIPILLLTIARDKLDEKRLRTLGIQGFLRKPFESATLLEQIEVTLQNHNQKFQKDSRNELENIEIVDEELMGLLSSKSTSEITFDSLEEELDPTLQLHPIEAESMLLDDEEQPEGFHELSVELESEEDELPLEEDGFPEFEDTGEESELYDLETEQAETEAIELELEEISLDIDEYDQEISDHRLNEPLPVSGSADTGITEIQVISAPLSAVQDSIENISENGEIGLMELEVLPLEQEDTELEVREIDDFADSDTKLLTQLNVVFTDMGENISQRGDSIVDNVLPVDGAGLPFIELEVLTFEPEDVIEIEHTEINDDLDDGFEAVYDEEFDDSDLLEISVEGIDTEEGEAFDETSEEQIINADEIDESLEEVDLPQDNYDDLLVSEPGDDDDDLLLDDEADDLLISEAGDDDDLLLDDEADDLLISEAGDDDDLLLDDEADDLLISEAGDDDDHLLLDEDSEDIVVSNIPDELQGDISEDEEIQEVEGLDESNLLDTDEMEPAVIEQDETDNLEFDFEAHEELLDEDEEDETDESDLMLEELEGIDPESAQMNIQEMINFRQVMKAKYDIPETESSELAEEDLDDEDLEIDFLSDDEIEDFDLAEELDSTEDSLILDDGSPDDDSDLLLEEFSDDTATDGDVTQDDDLEEVDIFSDVSDDEIGEVDLFADTDTTPDSDAEEGDLFDDSMEAIADDESFLPEDDTLIDDTYFEEADDEPFDSGSDEIDLLSDDLALTSDTVSEDEGADDDDTKPDSILDDSEEPDLDASDLSMATDDIESDELLDEMPEQDLSAEESVDEADDPFWDGDATDDSDFEFMEDHGSETDLLLDDDIEEDHDLLGENGIDDDIFSDAPDDLETADSSLFEDTADFELADDTEDLEGSFEEIELSEPEPAEDGKTDSIGGFEIPSGDDAEELSAISEADEIAIEVPLDVFEISDMKMADIADNIEADRASADEVLQPMTEDTSEKDEISAATELTEEIELPAMDEDLPDLPSVFDEESGDDDLMIEMDEESSDDEPEELTIDNHDELLADPVGEEEAIGDDIEILQSEDDFDSFPDESETIAFSDEPTEVTEATAEKETPGDEKKAQKTLSPDLRDKLSGMIENAISETIQNTLHEMLPDMMDKIIREELED